MSKKKKKKKKKKNGSVHLVENIYRKNLDRADFSYLPNSVRAFFDTKGNCVLNLIFCDP